MKSGKAESRAPQKEGQQSQSSTTPRNRIEKPHEEGGKRERFGAESRREAAVKQ